MEVIKEVGMIYNIGPRSVALAMTELLKSDDKSEEVRRRLLVIIMEAISERTTQQDSDSIYRNFEELNGFKLCW